MNEENNELVKTEVINITPKDGLVHDKDVSDIGEHGEHHYGYQTRTITTISDPKIVKRFIYIFCSIFIIIGLLLCIGSWVIGLSFILIGVFTLVSSLQSVKRREKEMEDKGIDVKSINEGDTLTNHVKTSFETASKEVFTKDKFKWFVKISVPFTIIVLLLCSILFGFMFYKLEGLEIGIAAGAGVFILVGLFMIFFYWILSKFFKN